MVNATQDNKMCEGCYTYKCTNPVKNHGDLCIDCHSFKHWYEVNRHRLTIKLKLMDFLRMAFDGGMEYERAKRG
jgi:hypothetical protein